MRKFYVFSVLGTFGAIIVTAIAVGAPFIGIFVSVPALVITVLPALLLSLGNFGLREIGRCFSIAFSRQVDVAELRTARAFFRSVGGYVIVSGVLGVLIGVTALLSNLMDAATLGRGMATALLSAAYAAVLYMVAVVPFQAGIERRLAEAKSA